MLLTPLVGTLDPLEEQPLTELLPAGRRLSMARGVMCPGIEDLWALPVSDSDAYAGIGDNKLAAAGQCRGAGAGTWARWVSLAVPAAF